MPDSFRVSLPFFVNVPAHCAVWASYVLTACHLQQFARIRQFPKEAVDMDVIDFTFDVLLLPVTFGVLALHCIRILPDRGGRDLWGATATLDAAEMWESWALWSFQVLLTRYVKASDEGANHFYGRFEKICVMGVQQYVFFNFGSNILEFVFREVDRYNPELCGKIWGHDKTCEEDFSMLQEYIIGALWYSCSIAIYSILQFESAVSSCLRGIDPAWKFWGAKIIVSVAGMQRLALYALMKFGFCTEVFTWYLHSYFLCFETLFLSLLHFKAYPVAGHFVHGEPKQSTVGDAPATYGKRTDVSVEDRNQVWSPADEANELSAIIDGQEVSGSGALQDFGDLAAPQIIGRVPETSSSRQSLEHGANDDMPVTDDV